MALDHKCRICDEIIAKVLRSLPLSLPVSVAAVPLEPLGLHPELCGTTSV